MDTNYHFIGIGGAGSNVVEYFHSLNIKGFYTLISDPVRQNLPSRMNFIFFDNGKEKLKNSSDVSLLFKIIEPIPNEILKIFESNKTYILLAGLGGYTGTILTQQLISYLESKNKNYLVIACLPLAFESEKAISISNQFILNSKDNKRIQYFAMEELRLNNGDLNLSQFFEKANEKFVELFYKGINELDSSIK